MAVGLVSAMLVGLSAYAIIREPASRTGTDRSLTYLICCPRDDAAMTALLWASGAYMLTFTPTLILCQRRIRKDEFSPRQPLG